MSSEKKIDNCLFCRIIRKEIPSYVIYEDKEVIAFLDILPVNPGHALVLPKRHFDSFLEMDEKSITSVFSAAKDIANSILKAVNAHGFNLLVNDKKAAGQLIDHVHIHIIPRFEGDGYEHWHGKRLSDEEMRTTADKVKSRLK